jgi:hypothetical protein
MDSAEVLAPMTAAATPIVDIANAISPPSQLICIGFGRFYRRPLRRNPL